MLSYIIALALALLFVRAFVGVQNWYIARAIKHAQEQSGVTTLQKYRRAMDGYTQLGYGIDVSLRAFTDHSTRLTSPKYSYRAMLFGPDKQKLSSGIGTSAEEAAYNAIQNYEGSAKPMYSPYRIVT